MAEEFMLDYVTVLNNQDLKKTKMIFMKTLKISNKRGLEEHYNRPLSTQTTRKSNKNPNEREEQNWINNQPEIT